MMREHEREEDAAGEAGPAARLVLNGFFVALVLVSVLVAAFTGSMEAVSASALDAAKKSVELALGLVGAMSLFMGLMKVAQDGGLLRLIASAAARSCGASSPTSPRIIPR